MLLGWEFGVELGSELGIADVTTDEALLGRIVGDDLGLLLDMKEGEVFWEEVKEIVGALLGRIVGDELGIVLEIKKG